MWVFFELRGKAQLLLVKTTYLRKINRLGIISFERDVSVIFWGTNLDKGVVSRYPVVDESNHPPRGGILRTDHIEEVPG